MPSCGRAAGGIVVSTVGTSARPSPRPGPEGESSGSGRLCAVCHLGVGPVAANPAQPQSDERAMDRRMGEVEIAHWPRRRTAARNHKRII